MGYRWVETRGEKEKPAIDRMGASRFLFNVVVVYWLMIALIRWKEEDFSATFTDLVGLAIPSPKPQNVGPPSPLPLAGINARELRHSF